MWPKGPTKWIENRVLYVSIPFTWNLPKVRAELRQGDYRYDRAVAGGPAVDLMPGYLAEVAEIGHDMPGVLQRVNPQATRSTLGCPKKCRFCGIGCGLIEPGGLREIEDWPDLPIYCDNNLLAATREHFDQVIDRLKGHPFADFNQGLDASLLTDYHACRLAELRRPTIRFAWDTAADEAAVRTAIRIALDAGISRHNLRCYVLVGWQDTPEEALYRLKELDALGIRQNPMCYTPLDALERGRYINEEKGWTREKMLDCMKYWSNRRFFAGIPFEEFARRRRGPEPRGQRILTDTGSK